MTAAVKQWGRVARVIVDRAGVGISIENLRIRFEVAKSVGRTPNKAVVKIYNLNPTHEAQVTTEFDDLILEVGYSSAALGVFRGNITRAFRYRDGVDSITEVHAGDGDRDFRKATCNFSLAAGANNDQLIARIVDGFTTTTKGYVPVRSSSRTRGRVFCGMARDVLDRIARQQGSEWSIQDGVLDIVPVDSTTPTEAVRLTSETGMLDCPEITDKGVIVRCLLNPTIKPNGKVQIDNNSVREKMGKAKLARLDPDGVYKVIRVIHKGDTRDTEWVSEMTCVALGGIVTTSAAPTTAATDNVDGGAP